MTHQDEGRLRALLDGELFGVNAEAARAHLDGCGECRARLSELQAASVAVGAALAHLDTVAVPAGARSVVLARVGRRGRSRPERFALARAAVLVLFFGTVVATALPASPLRGWMEAGWERVVAIFTGPTPDAGTVASVEDVAPSPQTLESAGVRLEVGTGELVVLLEDMESGTELDVYLVDGFQAATFAAQPARFRTAEGLIEVTGGSGRVRVEIPRSVETASIHVNGRIYITKAGDALDVTGPIVTRTPDEVHLRVR